MVLGLGVEVSVRKTNRVQGSSYQMLHLHVVHGRAAMKNAIVVLNY